MSVALTGARVFDGTSIVDGHSVVVADGRIAALVPDGECPSDARTQLIDGLLAPGFIDVQVNGGGGVLFNQERTAEGIAAIGARSPAIRHHRLSAHLHHRYARAHA